MAQENVELRNQAAGKSNWIIPKTRNIPIAGPGFLTVFGLPNCTWVS